MQGHQCLSLEEADEKTGDSEIVSQSRSEKWSSGAPEIGNFGNMCSPKWGWRTSFSQFHPCAAPWLRVFGRIHEATESGRSSYSTNTYHWPVLRCVVCNNLCISPTSHARNLERRSDIWRSAAITSGSTGSFTWEKYILKYNIEWQLAPRSTPWAT